MFKQITLNLLIVLFVSFTSANAQAPNNPRTTKFEQYVSRTNALIVTRSFVISKPNGPSAYIDANMAWEPGKPKMYAATINSEVVDFHEIQETIDGIDKVLNAIKGDSDKIDQTSIRLTTGSGLSINFMKGFDAANSTRQNFYLRINERFITQGPTSEPLVHLRESLAEAQRKLISWGAK